MHYLVDGYNLIFTREQEYLSLEEQRAMLIGRLKKSKRQITVIFDGSDETRRGNQGKLSIVYTGGAESADDYILHELESHLNPKVCTVVTADRRLANQARYLGAQVIDGATFLARLAKKN